MHTTKIAPLTGTSSGIGLAAAVALARAGYTYAGMFAAYLARARGMTDGAQTPEAVGEEIVALAGRAEPPLRVQSSELASQFVALKLREADGASLTATMRAWLAPA